METENDRKPTDMAQVSDGYHTFAELYEQRSALFIALCRQLAGDPYTRHYVWKSKTHSDGTTFEGWFVMGVGAEPGEQITYHMPESLWDACGFCDTREQAPSFDGHTSADVIARLGRLGG